MGLDGHDGDGDGGQPERPWNEVEICVNPGKDNWATFTVPDRFQAFQPRHLRIAPTPPELWVSAIEVAGAIQTVDDAMIPAASFAPVAFDVVFDMTSAERGETVRVQLTFHGDRPLVARVVVTGRLR